MKARISYPFAMAVLCGAGAALGLFYLGESLFHSLMVLSIAMPGMYFQSRFKLKRMKLPPSTGFGEFFAAKKAANADRT